MAPLVSVLVVNWNGRKHLPGCLGGLGRQSLPRHRFEVVVVDNASADGSAEHVADRFPWVRLVRLGANVGFAEGNNVAARFAHGRRLVLLNNDTVPDPHWLAELVRCSDQFPGAAVASKLVFAHHPAVVNSAGLFLARDGRGVDRGFRQPDVGQYEVEGPAFAGCGAAVLLPAPPRGEPLLDRRYFVYYEDLDEGWRARRAGRPCRYAPRAVVRHVVGAAAGDRSPLFWFAVERNRALTALRNADPFLAAWSAAGLFAKVGQAAALAAGGSDDPRGRWPVARAVARAAVSYLRHFPAVAVERYKGRTRRHTTGWFSALPPRGGPSGYGSGWGVRDFPLRRQPGAAGANPPPRPVPRGSPTRGEGGRKTAAPGEDGGCGCGS